MKKLNTSPIIYILNGPNLNLLGQREPHIYGTTTLKDIEDKVREVASALNFIIEFRQTNHEGELIDWIQEAGEKAQLIILNAAAYTHTSIGLLDALKAISIPVIEVHLSQPYLREPFRHQSFISPVAKGIIAGFGAKGYTLAIECAKEMLET